MADLSILLLVSLALLSLYVWGVISLRWSQGLPALESLPRISSPWLPIAGVAAGVYVALMLALNLLISLRGADEPLTVTLENVQASVADGVFHITIALLLLTGAGRSSLREAGISWRPPGRQLREGLLGFAASFLPVCAVLFATYSLRTLESQHPFLTLLNEHRSFDAAFWLMLSAVIIAPIKEELLFRVMLQESLARWLGSVPAIGIASILFCMAHGFPDSLALLPLAIILGYVYDRRQRALTVILIHALFNLTNMAILLLEPEATAELTCLPPGSRSLA
jgi:uncharacterized protein